MTAGQAASHPITPVMGSARRLDGTTADLMDPRDYPVEAVCLECGHPVRSEWMFLAGWSHVERFTLGAAS